MALTPIGSVNFLSEMSRKCYNDVGEVTCGYNAKLKMYNTSREIISDVEAYAKGLSDGETIVMAMVDYTPGNFFWLDCIYLKYIIMDNGEKHTLEIMINLKDSIEYQTLSASLDGDFVLVHAYTTYWRQCLKYVGRKVGVNLLESEVW